MGVGFESIYQHHDSGSITIIMRDSEDLYLLVNIYTQKCRNVNLDKMAVVLGNQASALT